MDLPVETPRPSCAPVRWGKPVELSVQVLNQPRICSFTVLGWEFPLVLGVEDTTPRFAKVLPRGAANERLRERLPWPVAAAIIIGSSVLCWSALAMLFFRFMV